MAAKRVSVKMRDGRVVAAPLDYLAEFWHTYSTICSACGLRWNKERGTASANIGSPDSLPEFVRSLGSAGISAVLDDECRAILNAAAKSGLSPEEEVSLAKVQEREALFAQRGLALWKPFQTDGAVFLASRSRALIGDEMGTGKTIQILTALPEGAPVFIVCPATILVNWAREIRKWRPEITPYVVLRSATLATKDLLENDGIHVVSEPFWPGASTAVIVNHESSPVVPATKPETLKEGEEPLVVTLDILPDVGTVLVGDEIHRVKNPKAKMTRRWARLRDAVLSRGGRVWGASGTPIYNRPFDLKNVLSGLDLFQDVFTSWRDFLRRMGGEQGRYGIEWTGRIDPTVPTSMRRVMIRREKKDVMAYLPAKTYREIEVEPSTLLKRIADDVQERCPGIAEAIDDLNRMRSEIQADAAYDVEEGAKRLLRDAEVLLGRAKASVPFEEFSRLHAEMSRVAYEASKDLIEAYEEQGEPLVVFCAHREPVERLGEREGWATILGGDDVAERAETIRRFQEGEFKGLALTIGAGREGITLTRACHVLFLSQSWSPSDNRQAEDRLHRGGQTRGVVVTTIVPNHPLIWRLTELLGWKERMHGDAIGAASLIDSLAQERAQAAQEALQADERARMAQGAAQARLDARVDVRPLLQAVPAGRYALDSQPDEQGRTHTVFWLLDQPTQGNWKGYAFLKVQRGPDAGRFAMVKPDGLATKACEAVLQRLAVNPIAASMRYGREVGECGVCGRALTDETSRAEGIGPVCKARLAAGGVL